VLVEGNFDVISLHQADFSDVVAPLGTALTLEQVLTLKRLCDRIVLLYDGDKAGYKATMHALQLCVEADVSVAVAYRPGNAKSGGGGELAGGVDPDSLVTGGGAEQLREAIDRAQGGIEFFCFEVWGKARANADARARALEDAARLIAKIDNPIKRDLVVDTFAKALDIETSLVRTAVGRAAAPGQGGGHGPGGGYRPSGGRAPDHPNAPEAQRSNFPSDPEKSSAPPPAEETELVSLLTDHPSLIASPEADKAFWLLTDSRLRDMYSAARAGQSFLELAPVKLPAPTAKHVLSGKYSESKDPRAQLLALISALEQKQSMLSQRGLLKSLVDAKRGGSDPELVRLNAQLAVAKAKRDHGLVEQLMAEIEKLASNRKQAE
jgi:DNA primase